MPLPSAAEAVPEQIRTSAGAVRCRERDLDLRLDILLLGIAPGVFKRIADSYVSLDDGAMPSSMPTVPAALTRTQIYAMSNSWQVACATGRAEISGDSLHARICSVNVQHLVETWLTERLRGPAPFSVSAAFHTPAPVSPLRQWADAPVPPALLAAHQRDDPAVQATIARRASSVRALLDAGATVHACYSAASLGKISREESEVYRATCAAYPNLIDTPYAKPPDAFLPLCGATYLFGTGPLSLTGCFAVRLPQAADATEGTTQAHLIVASPLDESFKAILDELHIELGLTLDPAYGGVATRALVDEPEYV